MGEASAALYGAIIAAVAALLGAIIGGIVSGYTVRETIRSKRYELAFQERLSAFNEILEAATDVNNRIDDFYKLLRIYDNDLEIVFLMHLREAEEEAKRRFFSSKDDFSKVYGKNRLYLPVEIDQEVKKYTENVLDLPQPNFIDNKEDPNRPPELHYERTKQSFDNYLARVDPFKETALEQIVQSVQSFIGL
jgi:hypothetical protein